MKLTTCIITLNEEKYIEKCIKSVLPISDEIIVVDSGSVDNTVDIAKSLGAKVFFRKFDNYSNQKNYACAKASGKWILSLDADEVIEKDLANEILDSIKTSESDAYSIPRKNIIFGKLIKFTRWQPELDRHVWLFKKNKGHWFGDVHEEIGVNGKVGKLKGYKVHYQYENISQFLEMMNKYSSLEAGQSYKQGHKFLFHKLVFSPIYEFLVRYFYRFGVLDGWNGLVLSLLMAIYRIEVELKLWELSK